MSERIGDHILVTHSAGGFSGWMSAMQNSEVKGVASYEPGGFVFPEDEVPERIDGLTGGVAGIAVSMEQFKRLTEFRLFFISEITFPKHPPRISVMKIGASPSDGPQVRRSYQPTWRKCHISRTS